MSKKNLNKQEQAALEQADWQRGIENCLTHIYSAILRVQHSGQSNETLAQHAIQELAKVMANSTQAAMDAERERQEEAAFQKKLSAMTAHLQQFVSIDKNRLAVISEADFETFLVEKWNYILDMEGEGEEVDERLQSVPSIAQPTVTYDEAMKRHAELKERLSQRPVDVATVQGTAEAECEYRVGELEIRRRERKAEYTSKEAALVYSAYDREDMCKRIDADIDERINARYQECQKVINDAKKADARRERELEELKALQEYLSANLENMFV